MLLKNIIDSLQEKPYVVLTIIMRILRSIEQNEQATLEGACASTEEWIKQFGEPTKEKITKWVENVTVPDHIIRWTLQESSKVFYPLVLAVEDGEISIYDQDGELICSRRIEKFDNIILYKKRMQIILNLLNEDKNELLNA